MLFLQCLPLDSCELNPYQMCFMGFSISENDSVCISSICRLYYSVQYLHTLDKIYVLQQLDLWAYVPIFPQHYFSTSPINANHCISLAESATLIICGCLPFCRKYARFSKIIVVLDHLVDSLTALVDFEAPAAAAHISARARYWPQHGPTQMIQSSAPAKQKKRKSKREASGLRCELSQLTRKHGLNGENLRTDKDE